MTFKTDDRVYETSTTTGTGTYTLLGAVTGFQAFSVMSANNDCPYFATDDTNWEVGIGTVLTGPARLQRTTILASSNGGTAIDWGAGTRKIRCGLPAAMAVHRELSKSVAGASDVTLTQDEQRRDTLVFTGALTGNINVIVDATLGEWTVYNNTSGAYTLTLKVSGGTGKLIDQGKVTRLRSDGTNIVDAINYLPGALAVGGAVTLQSTLAVASGIAVGGATVGSGGVAFPATAVAVADANTLDDYEEGTWTPALSNIGSGTLTEQYGRYRKIGSLVFLVGKLAWTGATGSAALVITGVPFAAADNNDNEQRASAFPCGDWTGINNLMDLNGCFRTNGSQLQGVIDDGTGQSVLMTAADLSSNGDFAFSLFYHV